MPRRSFLTKAGTRPQAEFYSAALFWRNLIPPRSNRIRPSTGEPLRQTLKDSDPAHPPPFLRRDREDRVF